MVDCARLTLRRLGRVFEGAGLMADAVEPVGDVGGSAAVVLEAEGCSIHISACQSQSAPLTFNPYLSSIHCCLPQLC